MDGRPQPLEEIALSNMWGIAALVEVLENKGLVTRDEVREAMQTLQNRHPEDSSSDREAGDVPAKGATKGRRVVRKVFPIQAKVTNRDV